MAAEDNDCRLTLIGHVQTYNVQWPVACRHLALHGGRSVGGQRKADRPVTARVTGIGGRGAMDHGSTGATRRQDDGLARCWRHPCSMMQAQLMHHKSPKMLTREYPSSRPGSIISRLTTECLVHRCGVISPIRTAALWYTVFLRSWTLF